MTQLITDNEEHAIQFVREHIGELNERRIELRQQTDGKFVGELFDCNEPAT